MTRRAGVLVLLVVGLLPGAVAARELRRQRTPAVNWRVDGGELGRKVRSGAFTGVHHLSFRSQALDEDIGLVVADPHAYVAGDAQNWPVVYFLNAYRGDEWALFGAAPGLVAELRREAIVVGVNQANSAGFGAAETMLAREVVEYVDGMRSTTRTAAGRALVGHSLGGMAASPT